MEKEALQMERCATCRLDYPYDLLNHIKFTVILGHYAEIELEIMVSEFLSGKLWKLYPYWYLKAFPLITFF